MPGSIVSRDEWLAARLALLAEEKALTRARDALAARRRALPWVRVDKDYEFRTPEGAQSLTQLFGRHSQLIVVHFMFGPDWQQGCPSCSFWADGYDGIDLHLAHRDAAFVVVSNTALQNIERYRAPMGWRFRWVSSLGSEFNRDFQASFTPDEVAGGAVFYNFGTSAFPATEAPGVSVFHRPEPGTIVHTYATYARGLDALNVAYQFMDLLPKGRDEDGLDFTMAWLRRRDQYGD